MKATKNEIYTVSYIQDGCLFDNYVFLDREMAFAFGDRLFSQVKNQMQSPDYIALEFHEPNLEKPSIRLKQWDIEDLEETMEGETCVNLQEE